MMNELTVSRQLTLPDTLDQIQIGIASPERIRSRSFGEIKQFKRSTTTRSNAMACSACASSVRS